MKPLTARSPESCWGPENCFKRLLAFEQNWIAAFFHCFCFEYFWNHNFNVGVCMSYHFGKIAVLWSRLWGVGTAATPETAALGHCAFAADLTLSAALTN